MKTAWLLLVMYGHSGFAIPNIATEQECERLYVEMRDSNWAAPESFIRSNTHRCIQYVAAN